MTDTPAPNAPGSDDRDPGASIGNEPEREGDSSDVVEGPIGSASLRDPGEIEEEGASADLERLPGVDVVADPT